ncbi:hypothetical protein LINPERPRIM_LOCUS20094 [Linum perenne]
MSGKKYEALRLRGPKASHTHKASPPKQMKTSCYQKCPSQMLIKRKRDACATCSAHGWTKVDIEGDATSVTTKS